MKIVWIYLPLSYVCNFFLASELLTWRQQRDNLSNPVFNENNLGDLIVYGYSNHSKSASQPYDAEDIVMVSSCTAILEAVLTGNQSLRTAYAARHVRSLLR